GAVPVGGGRGSGRLSTARPRGFAGRGSYRCSGGAAVRASRRAGFLARGGGHLGPGPWLAALVAAAWDPGEGVNAAALLRVGLVLGPSLRLGRGCPAVAVGGVWHRHRPGRVPRRVFFRWQAGGSAHGVVNGLQPDPRVVLA